jgi:hypothetical protein
MRRRYEPQDTGIGRKTSVIKKRDWVEGEQHNKLVTMYNLYQEAIFQNSCSVRRIRQTHACFRATFGIVLCRSGFMIRG